MWLEYQYQGQIEGWRNQAQNAVSALANLRGKKNAAKGLDQALAELAQGKTKTAEAIFQQIANRKEANIEEVTAAYQHLGTLSFLHDIEKTLAAYRRAIELDPKGTKAWNWLGQRFIRMAQLNETSTTPQNLEVPTGAEHQQSSPVIMNEDGSAKNTQSWEESSVVVPLGASENASVFQDRLRDGSLGPVMVVVPAGEFIMGSPEDEEGRFDNERQHLVPIERPFAMGKYEVTFEEYDYFAEATGRAKPDDGGWGRGRRPVINVTWEDAVAYAEWLSEQTRETYRLPTEAEWEYAARAGTQTARYWGDDPGLACRYANVHDETSKQVNPFDRTYHACDDGFAQTAPVGRFQANAFELHDMLGNVWEWTCSTYDENYGGAEQEYISKNHTDPRVLRGGSWGDNPPWVRVASRYGYTPDFRHFSLGFRLARNL